MKQPLAKIIIFLLITTSIFLSFISISCETNEKVISIKKTIVPVNNSNISGTISFTQKNDSVHLEAHIFGLEAGTKALHLHEFGDCSSEDGLSAGGHWNPTNQKHGKWGDSEGYHLGDIGNFEIDEIGHGMLKFSTDVWCIGCESDNDILNKAVIIHNGTDDLMSQPSGAAGMRLGCYEIKTEANQ